MQKCKFCGKEVDGNIFPHERMCGQNPDRMGIKKGQKHRMPEITKIPQEKPPEKPIEKKVENAIKETVTDSDVNENDPIVEIEEKGNGLLYILLLFLLVIFALAIFFKDTLIDRFFSSEVKP